jgi:trk system potassium uptake protein TrkH
VITPRTAGFNTVDTGSLTDGGTFLTMVLMMIGASPGSTGGGIKTTTFVVMILAILSYVRNEDDINIGKRRLMENTFKKAYCVTGIYILLAGLSTFLIIATSDISMKDAAFEVLSALSTVGLSTGITRDLSTFSRIVIIICVYCGRVGSLTVLMAVFEKKQKAKITNVEEKIIVG